MSSHSILLGSSRSELQFIDDLINLCKRHQIGCGEPQDLDHLGADLLFNEDFRTDLFTLCTAIGHMTEIEPSPEQLLSLVARAFGGPSVSIRDVTVDVPISASSAFLNGFDTWSKRELNPYAASSWSEDHDQNHDQVHDQPPPSPSPRPTLYFAAAARSGADSSQPYEDPPAVQSTAEGPSHISVPPNTNIESLTLNELRMYLQDIESRVSRIEPKLDNIAPRPYFSPEYFQKLEALDDHKLHNTKLPALASDTASPLTAPSILPASQSLPFSASQSIVPIIEADSALPDIPYAPIIVPYQAAIAALAPVPSEISHMPSDIARLNRLRTVNMVLIFFLSVACCLTAFFAYRYLTGHPPSFTDTIHRFPTPLGEPSSDPGTPTATGSQPAPLPPATLFIPNPVYSAAPAAHPTHSSKTSRYTEKSGSGVSITPTAANVAASPAGQPPQATPSISDVYPDRNPGQINDHSLRPTTFASIAPSPSTPVDTPNATVSVPSTIMMTYAIEAPKPIYPGFRRIETDSTVNVETTISKEGRVVGAKALDGTLDVRAAAVEGVLGWRFKPFLVDGKPVGVVTTFKFVFKGH